MQTKADVAIIGGGIVGLATAYRLTQKYPALRVMILEKESEVARHQTGRNSGVLHSGIYYKPGSLRAQNCRIGKEAMEAFCEREGIDYDLCGKVIVATHQDELPTLEKIQEYGKANGVKCERIGIERLHELEPHCAGIAAIHVPEAGIVNYRQVALRLAERIREQEGEVITEAAVEEIKIEPTQVVVVHTQGTTQARYVISCAGLHSDRVARMTEKNVGLKIVPFRGEYYKLKPEASYLCQGLIYPVPDVTFPFLGVHFTRVITGGVECGPNAVLAFAREGYRKSIINVRDLAEALGYSGFQRLAFKNWKTGLAEMYRSFSKDAFVRSLQKLVPAVRSHHLIPAPSGVRAQALAPDGSLVKDFIIMETERVIHVCNAPSPAATASLNIGKVLVDKLANRFD